MILLSGDSGGSPSVAAPGTASAAQTVQTVVTVVRQAPRARPHPPRAAALSLRPYSTAAYSVQVPSTWRTVADDEDHGAYRESKWASPTGDGTFLIDYTVGFDGTARSGAEAVRSQTSQTDGYRELGWGPGQRDGTWQWTFSVPGGTRVDFFSVGCGTGYAALGSSSAKRFGSLQQLFGRAAKSLQPRC